MAVIGPFAGDAAERVGQEYWDRNWRGEPGLPETFDPRVGGVRGLFRRRFHAFFVDRLAPLARSNAALLEVGCGRSQLLPYFAREFGFRVAGLDYSPIGCDKARRILARDGIAGDIYEGDLFAAASDAGQYDVVFSFGLVEHFEDTAAVVQALSRYARPGGSVLTLIPNMRGSVGLLQRLLSRSVYDIHVPVSVTQLARAHAAAGLEIVSSGYVLPAHFGVCNPGTRPAGASGASRRLREACYRLAIACSAALLWVDESVITIPQSELLSPYAHVLARRPSAS